MQEASSFKNLKGTVTTPHRVQAENKDDLWPERHTMIFFSPPSNTWIDSKDLFPNEPNKFPSVSAGDYPKQPETDLWQPLP